MSTITIVVVPLLIVGLFSLWVVASVRVTGQARQVNRKLVTHNYFWSHFKIVRLPICEPERSEALVHLGYSNSITQELGFNFFLFNDYGKILSLLIGAYLTFGWAFYPRTKKEAFLRLAEENQLSAGEIDSLIVQLDNRAIA